MIKEAGSVVRREAHCLPRIVAFLLVPSQRLEHPAVAAARAFPFGSAAAAPALALRTAIAANVVYRNQTCAKRCMGSTVTPSSQVEPTNHGDTALPNTHSSGTTTEIMSSQEGPTQQQLQQEKTLKESLRSAGVLFRVRSCCICGG